jgi:hypothetical protein
MVWWVTDWVILEAMHASVVQEKRGRTLDRTFREWRKVGFGDRLLASLLPTFCGDGTRV